MSDYKFTQNTATLQKYMDGVGHLFEGEKVDEDGVVDENGRCLSKENYTSAEKTKLGALPTNAQLETALDAKQDVIEDLTSIRNKANSAYQKPASGIPKTDLDASVKDSLDKADSSMQKDLSAGENDIAVFNNEGQVVGAFDVNEVVREGRIKQTTGQSTTDLMSQKAVTDGLNAKAAKDEDAVEGNLAKFDSNGNPVDAGIAAEEINQLGQEVVENEMEVIKRIGGEKRYQKTESCSGRILVADFPVKAGFTLTVKLVAAGVTPTVGIRVRALRTDNQYYQLGNLTAIGGSVSLLLGTDIVSVDTYNNDANTTQTIEIEAAIATEGEVLKEVGYQMVVPTVAESGKILFNGFKSEVSATSSSTYSISSTISVPAHSIIHTMAYGVDCRIAQVTETGYIPLVEGINNPNTIVSWANNSDSAVNVVVCYLSDLKVAIYKDVFSDILSLIPNIEDYGKLIDTTPAMNFVDGMVVAGEVKTNVFGNYKHSASPISVKRGEIICIKEASSLYILAALYKTDASQTYAKHLLPGWESSTPGTRYYIIDFDGYVGFCSGNNMTKFNFRKFSISEGVIPEIIKPKKEFIGMTATSEQTISVDSIGFCNITKSLAKRISGNGNATITFTLDKQAMGRTFSIGFRLPYSFQDVASMTLNGSNFASSGLDARTASGKTYLLEGDHFHRCNFNVCDSKFTSFDIVVTSSEDWYFEISDGGVVNDDLPIIPIVVGYDIAYDYRATFPYNGDNISIYELHKRLNIPYYVALTGDQTIVNPEVAEAIASGLCERVFYGGGDLANYWNKIDGSLSQQIILKKSAHEGMGTMYVVSQSVLDRNMFSGIVNSGVDIIRHFFSSEKRKGEFGQMYGDNNVYYGGASALGNTAFSRIMNYPQLWYAHGIGTPVNPDDPYASNYQDPTGANTIALFNIWKTMEARGELAVMKPSDWIAYLKQQR